MKKLIFTVLTICTCTATAGVESQTTLASSALPTDASIKKSISNLYKALNAKKESDKKIALKSARSLLNEHKLETSYPGAVYVDNVKQFEDGEDSVYDFDKTCFAGSPDDVAKLINSALKQGLWSGDEESVQSAKANGHNVTLKVHDGPNDEDTTIEIEACK